MMGRNSIKPLQTVNLLKTNVQPSRQSIPTSEAPSNAYGDSINVDEPFMTLNLNKKMKKQKSTSVNKFLSKSNSV